MEALDFIIKSSSDFLVSRDVCEQNPDLINDIFGMAMRYVRYNKALFFSSQHLELFVQFMLTCIGLDQFRAAKAHSEFLQELLRCLYDDLHEIGFEPTPLPGMIQREQILWTFIRSRGAQMVSEYIKALLLVPSKEVAQFFVDVLVSMCQSFIGESELWLTAGLQQVPLTVLTGEDLSLIHI